MSEVLTTYVGIFGELLSAGANVFDTVLTTIPGQIAMATLVGVIAIKFIKKAIRAIRMA